MNPIVPAPDLTLRVAALEAKLALLDRVLTISPTGDVTIKAGAALRLDAGTSISVRAFSTINIAASGTMTLQGAVININ